MVNAKNQRAAPSMADLPRAVAGDLVGRRQGAAEAGLGGMTDTWEQLVAHPPAFGRLMDFHRRHKYLIMAHSPEHCRALGRLVGTGKQLPIDRLYAEYRRSLTEAFRCEATVGKHVNALQHIMGYFKRDLTADERRAALGSIADYARGEAPRAAPLALLRSLLRKYPKPYLAEQSYLEGVDRLTLQG